MGCPCYRPCVGGPGTEGTKGLDIPQGWARAGVGRQAAWRTQVRAGREPHGLGLRDCAARARPPGVSLLCKSRCDQHWPESLHGQPRGGGEPRDGGRGLLSCGVSCVPCTPQLFQIDVTGCVEVVRERKAWPPALLQAGAWNPPPPQVRTESECLGPQVPATLHSCAVGE